MENPNLKLAPKLVVVAGTSSSVGKTTLVCDLLGLLSGWEAIKVTRGHYRSCGKQSEACCVSHLLGERPIVHSDPTITKVSGKDTERFWQAGATGVHWVIAKSNQVNEGLTEALSRVRSPGVIIETTSGLDVLTPLIAVLVARQPVDDIKQSARRALKQRKIDAVYVPFAPVGDIPPWYLPETNAIPFFDSASKSLLFNMVCRRLDEVEVLP